MDLHQILLQTRQDGSEKHRMLKQTFGNNALGVLDDLRPEPRPKMWQKFDIEGIVHKEFIPPGQTVNGKYYFTFV
jgi:hypothetical protein